jgi:hypothetical protein
MRRSFFFIILLLIIFSNINAQSYLYNKDASGPAFSYSRILGTDAFAVDFTYKGRFSIGGTMVGLDQSNRVFGINGVVNIFKKENRSNVISVPLFLGYQSVNSNSLLSYGAGFYVKSFPVNNITSAAGISYLRSKVENREQQFGQFGMDFLLFYKALKIGPSLIISNEKFSFGFTVGFAFNHNNTLFLEKDEYLNTEN